jgi:hypothetical protein
VLCSGGLLWYLNFSDGTKPERRDYEIWQEGLSSYLDALSRGGMSIGMTKVPDPNELLNIQRKISADYAKGLKPSPAEQFGAWQNWNGIQAALANVGAQELPLPEAVHLEVRNRDYFYSPAFVFMSLLYGLGIGFCLINIQRKRANLLLPSGIAIAVLCGAIPLFANYKEHNRGNLWVPWDYAYNLLMSCEPNAILFTNGDNDTFPLWFAQEVAGIRKDVRVVNLSLGNTDWYIKQMLENEPILKLRYDKNGIDNRMVLSESNYRDREQKIDFWVERATAAIPTLEKRIELLDERLDSARAAEADTSEISKELFRRKVWLQTYMALKEWGEPRSGGIMQTQYKLVVDLTMYNLDKPIHVSTTVGLSNAVGLEKYMVQKGMVWDLVKGVLSPVKDSVDIGRTAFLVDSVFKYRGLGDGTTYINNETEQLLSNYNSIYMRLTSAMADSIAYSRAMDNSADIQRILDKGLHYADIGIKQFSKEWRNYAIAAELLQIAGENARAAEYLKKGLAEISSDTYGKRYLSQMLDRSKGLEP